MTRSTVMAARSSTMPSSWPVGRSVSSRSTAPQTATEGQRGSGGPSGVVRTPAASTLIAIRRAGSSSRAGTPESTAAPRTTCSRPARDCASRSK
ncbi:hypothetical protein ACFQV8_09985 [Pseudonocardia benzenivorans]